MIALLTLKAQLEPFVNQEDLSEDFKEAISDGIYAIDLSQVALEQWISCWNGSQDVDYLYGGEFSKEYQQGVRFVEQQWEAITGMF